MRRTTITAATAAGAFALALAISGCGAPGGSSPSHEVPSSAPVTHDVAGDLTGWWVNTGPDVTQMTDDMSAFSTASTDGQMNTAATKVLADVDTLQADPPVPSSAPAVQRTRWHNALADVSSAMIYIQAGDYSTATVKITQGTHEISQFGDYIGTLN